MIRCRVHFNGSGWCAHIEPDGVPALLFPTWRLAFDYAFMIATAGRLIGRS